MQFINAGHLSNNFNLQNPMTTNNYTERMNRSIESHLTEKQTVVTFIKQLYEIKLLYENLHSEETNKNQYESIKITPSINRRLNHERLYFLIGLVKSSGHPNYYYIKKPNESNTIVNSFEDDEFIELKDYLDYFQLMIKQLAKNCVVKLRDSFYVVNMLENGPFYDDCKHCHAAQIFLQENHPNIIQETKEKLVNYFKNKERIIPADQKNNLIYYSSTEDAYQEIIRLFNSE
ncbi:11210_t:CDS:2, partial [Racocetra fulgida]